jgi:hypothetical protein
MSAYTRHNEVLFLDSHRGTIDAKYFNIAQTALKRSRDPIRFKIPSLNHLDLLIQADAWIIVDRVLNDMPIVAWTGFNTQGRDNLHEPLACEVRLYHFAARMVMNTTFKAMQEILGQTLKEQATGKSDKKVVEIPKDE